MKTIGGVKSENGVSSKEVSTPNSEPEKIDFSKVKVEPLFEEDVDFDTFSKSDFRAVKVKECVAVPKSKKLQTHLSKTSFCSSCYCSCNIKTRGRFTPSI